MAGTRRKPQPVVEAVPSDAEGSDDEAPEEIGLSSGKEIALQKTKEERQVREAVTEERKTRRKALQERNEEQKRAKARDDAARKEEGAAADGGEAAPHAEEAAEVGTSGPDLLPAEVLEALAQQRAGSLAERQARVVSHALQRKVQEAAAGRRKRLRPDALEKGPVTVQVLSAAKRLAAAGRGNFRKEQLLGQGAGAKRSLDMLRPPAAARHGPSAKFT